MNHGSETSLVDFVDSTTGPDLGSTRDASAAPLEHWTRIAFRAGRVGLLDVASERGAAWAQVLDSLRQRRAPAYVEMDPASSRITRLLIPQVVTVGQLSPDPAGVEVELIISHARHLLRQSHPRYQDLLDRLKAAQASGVPVAVTEDPNSHDIIDVSALAGTGGRVPPPPDQPEPAAAERDAAALASLSPAQAQQLFDLMNGTVCCPSGPAAPCIPFGYPDDGCWGRAHEMYRLLGNRGVPSNKIWIYGNLRARTTNNPRCEVRWGWHVAPTVEVDNAGHRETYVIDPSLFPGPVTLATWAGVQGDPAASLVPSAGSVFYRSRGGTTQTDPRFTETNRVLADYRDALRLRSVGSDGPPPYPACLPGKAGVQFYGTIAAGATHSWFTYGWPAGWHVIWTVVPQSTCPGAPQLKCRTRVERADANTATYWILVTNTSNATVRFEGRYDILSR